MPKEKNLSKNKVAKTTVNEVVSTAPLGQEITLDPVVLNGLITVLRENIFEVSSDIVVLGLYRPLIDDYFLVKLLDTALIDHKKKIHNCTLWLLVSPQSYLVGILDTKSKKVIIFDDNPNSSESQSSSKEKPTQKQGTQGRQAVEKQARKDRLANVVEQVSRLLQLIRPGMIPMQKLPSIILIGCCS